MKKIYILGALILCLAGCRTDDIVYPPVKTEVGEPELISVSGLYLLNEGNMGSNKSTLDYYDYATGIYSRNIYGSANPTVPKELGDVGNDLQVYRGKLWAVVNCSNKIEVMDAADAVRIGQVDIPNCRHIRFHDGYAYVTSYAGPVEINPDYSQIGFVAKIDVETLEIVARCNVGYQPDGLAISGGYIYVCNSGGYRVPNYENTVSIISLDSFAVESTAEIAVNLQYAVADDNGRIWISSRGDYYDNPSRLYCFDPRRREVIKEFDTPVGSMWLDGDMLYVLSSGWNFETMTYTVTNAVIDTDRLEVVSDNFIADASLQEMERPYSVAVNPINKDIFVTDAGNYVAPGWLYCFSPEGIRKWKVRTGDIPAHIAFVGEFSN